MLLTSAGFQSTQLARPLAATMRHSDYATLSCQVLQRLRDLGLVERKVNHRHLL